MGIVIFIDKIEYIAHVVFTIPEGFSQARSEWGTEARAPSLYLRRGGTGGAHCLRQKRRK